jgi:hypothetical protein
LLCNDCETGKYTTEVSTQRIGKYVSVATDTQATIVVFLDYNNGNGVFYVVRVETLQAESVEFQSGQLAGSSVLESVKKGPERGKLRNLHSYKPLPGNGW